MSPPACERARVYGPSRLYAAFPVTASEPARLRRTAGPVLLWALGVGYVISGDYFGWNFGLAAGGMGGMAIATVIMATMYGAMIVSIAELATAMPVAGGPFAFARRALGPAAGFVTGLAVAIEYTIAPAVIATGIAGYLAGWLGDPDGVVTIAATIGTYALFVGLNLLGSHASLRVLLAITAVAALVLVVWAIAVVPFADPARWLDVVPDAGASRWLPHGVVGIFAALPAAGWRRREPELHRPYRTPLAPFTPALALLLALVALGGSLLHGVAAGTSVLATVVVLALGIVYFAVFVRRRVAARSVDEELAIVRAAEAELD